MQGNEGLYVPSSEHFFADLKDITGFELNPVKGFQDEGIYASLLMFCDKPTISLVNSRKAVAMAGDGVDAIWSSSDHQCTLLYCGDMVADSDVAAKKKRLVDHIAQEMSANVSCRDASSVVVNPAEYILFTKALRHAQGTSGDTICVYLLPDPGCMRLALDDLKHLSETRFPHDRCLGVLVTGRSANPLRFKLLLSEKGFRHKNKYIKQLMKSIRFEE